MDKSTRREFLKQATLVAGVGALTPISQELLAEPAKPAAKSRVVIAQDPKMLTGEDGPANLEVVKTTLNKGMVSLTGTKNPTAAWKKLFGPTDVVGIKVNCIAGLGCSTRPEVAMAIAAGLQMAGVKPENIIIWDRTSRELINSGYTLCQEAGKVQVIGVDKAWDESASSQGSFNGKFAQILSTRITALVNAPILKDHGGAGVTLSMKNHYGSIDNPGAHHGNGCDPYLADISAHPVVRKKTRLIVADALKALCNGGPGRKPKYMWNYNGLLLATDTVAVDYTAWQIIDEQRKVMGLKTLEETGRPPRYIASAAERGLGNNDPAKIQTIRV